MRISDWSSDVCSSDLAAGYGFLYHGQKGFNGVAILARGTQPVEVQRGLAGEAEDEQSRYLEADVFGIRVASIYLPNGNPQPGPKFDYKLRWMQRSEEHTSELQSLMRISYAVFCLKKKKQTQRNMAEKQ